MEGKPEQKANRRFGRVRTWVGRRLHPPRSRRGLLLLVAVVAGIGVVVTIIGIKTLAWTESESFCKSCHAMSAEAKAYKRSPHRDVACAECHVRPGFSGWVKAKIRGSEQAIEVIADTYPKSIPKPVHDELPSVKDTCMKCHSVPYLTRDGGEMNIVLRPNYKKDRNNTKKMTAVVVRTGNVGNTPGTRGAHWHLDKRIEFASHRGMERKMDWIKVTDKNGKSKEFISRSHIRVSSDVRPEIAKIKRSETPRQMDCIDCHNRVGHDIPTPGRAIDDSIAAGKISQGIPYIKRESISRLKAKYPSTEAADRAIDSIRETYAAKYPLVLKSYDRALSKTIQELKRIYQRIATPEMNVTAETYLNNLGHQNKSQGCFRCHDGRHYQVAKKGQVLKKKIPSTCTTCHTFPVVGTTVSNVSLKGKPRDHKVNWPFNHARAIETKGSKACTYCHQSSS